MSRRRHNRRSHNYTPPRVITRRAQSRPSAYEIPRRNFSTDFVTYIPAKRASALDHSVLSTSTVRRPLMRTVLRDTRPSLPGNLRRRHTPDLPVRVTRWAPWATFSPDNLRSPDRPLTRAVTCAKRHIRKEVLFALSRLNGAGGRGKPKSNVRC